MHSKRRTKRYYLVILVFIALAILLGLNFVIDSRNKAEERTRMAQAEQDRKKIEKKTFGYSVMGKPIDGYEIGNGANAILLFASIHGDEVGTVELLNKYIEEISANPDKISKTKKIIVIPIVNPDGYYDRLDKLNADLVNLNLNFQTSGWKEYGPEGNYAGPQPFSEPESKTIEQIVAAYKPVLMISYHTRGAIVTPEADDASIKLAHWYADKTGYEYYDIWEYSGTATKWFVETTNMPAITVELTEYLEGDWEINKEALLELVFTDDLPTL